MQIEDPEENSVSAHAAFHEVVAQASRTYQADLKQFQPFLEGGRSLVEAYLAFGAWLEQECATGRYSAATFNRKVSAARHLLRHAYSAGPELEVLRTVELKRVEPAAVLADVALSVADARLLVAGTRDIRIRLMIAFLVGTGARISEMLSLRLADLTPTERGFTEARVTWKDRHSRSLHVRDKLLEKIVGCFKGESLLFEHDGRPYSRISVTNRIKQEAVRVLGREVSAQQLRHTWVLAQVSQGREPKAAMKPEEAFLDLHEG